MKMAKRKSLSREELRQRIIKRCRKVVRDCEQTIRDGEYWQNLPHNRQTGQVLDLEHFRAMRNWALRTIQEFTT